MNLPPWYFLFAPLWLGGWVFASVWYRKSRNKDVFPRVPENSLFSERRASGHSNQNIITKIGGARNCLMVAVTPTMLMISPTFPFTLMFLPEIYRLDHRIAKTEITAVTKRAGLFGVAVRIEFQERGRQRGVDLFLRQPDQFIEAISTAR